MNKRFSKQLLTILTIGTILLACSSSDTKNEQNQESTETEKEKNLSDKDPEVILAIIQEGTNPPSEQLVESFGELLSSLKGFYTDIATTDMADKLAMAYDLAAEKGNEESLLEFVEGFRTGVQNSINSNTRFDFTQYLANYACYKTNCDNVNAEMSKFFESGYTIPSRKSQYEGGDFVLIKDIETFKERFNSFSEEVTSSLRVRQVKIHEGKPTDPGQAFEYAFSNHLYVVGGLNKNGNSLRTLAIILENTDSPSDIANFLVATLGAIASVDPDLKPEERGDILAEIGLSDPQRINSEDSWTDKTVKNGIQYTLAFIYGQGFIFNAEKPSE